MRNCDLKKEGVQKVLVTFFFIFKNLAVCYIISIFKQLNDR